MDPDTPRDSPYIYMYLVFLLKNFLLQIGSNFYHAWLVKYTMRGYRTDFLFFLFNQGVCYRYFVCVLLRALLPAEMSKDETCQERLFSYSFYYLWTNVLGNVGPKNLPAELSMSQFWGPSDSSVSSSLSSESKYINHTSIIKSSKSFLYYDYEKLVGFFLLNIILQFLFDFLIFSLFTKHRLWTYWSRLLWN